MVNNKKLGSGLGLAFVWGVGRGEVRCGGAGRREAFSIAPQQADTGFCREVTRAQEMPGLDPACKHCSN